MSSEQIQLALWALQPVLQVAVALVMIRRGLSRSFPVFFTFTLVQIGIFGFEFSAYRWSSHQVYFDVFWIAMGLNLIIEFKIIHEVFLDVFRPYHALKDLGTALFRWSALIMILVSVVVISVSPGFDSPVTRTVLVAHRCLRVIQCGMVLFLLAHMYGNLKLFYGRSAFDGYARHLRTVGEPFLPYAGALWIIRVVLLVSVPTPIGAAVALWTRSRRATGGRGGLRYESARGRRGVQRSYSSFTMRWGGVTIALFVRRFPAAVR